MGMGKKPAQPTPAPAAPAAPQATTTPVEGAAPEEQKRVRANDDAAAVPGGGGFGAPLGSGDPDVERRRLQGGSLIG